MRSVRNVFVVLGLIFISALVQGLTWQPWFEAFVINRLHSTYAGIRLDVLMEQIPTMVTFLLLGALCFVVVDSSRPHLWALILGAVAAGLKAASSRTVFTGFADLADRVNYLATYVYPSLFALLGATVVWLLLRGRGTPLTRLAAARKPRRARRTLR